MEMIIDHSAIVHANISPLTSNR